MEDLQGTSRPQRDDTSGPHQTSSARDDSDSDRRPLPGSLAAATSTPTMMDASTQVPERDRIKEECEDKREIKKEIKREIKEEIPTETEEDPESPDGGECLDDIENVKIEPALQDPKIKEECERKVDVSTIVTDGASSLDVERGIKNPTKTPNRKEVANPISSGRVPASVQPSLIPPSLTKPTPLRGLLLRPRARGYSKIWTLASRLPLFSPCAPPLVSASIRSTSTRARSNRCTMPTTVASRRLAITPVS